MDGLNIKPLHDKIVVEPFKAEEITQGGIIIPETAQEKPQRGKIIAVGSGKKDDPMILKVGDNVLYDKNAGVEISIDGNMYLIMKQSDILVKI